MAFIDVKEVAERLAVSVATVYSLCNERKLGHVRVGRARGVIRIREKDLEEFIERASVFSADEAPVASASRCACAAKYSSSVRLRRNSRLIVDGARPMACAISFCSAP